MTETTITAGSGVAIAVELARAVRTAGVPVSVDRTVLLAEALAATGLTDRERVFAAGRSVCCSGPDDFAAYAAGFAAVFGTEVTARHPIAAPPRIVVTDSGDDPSEADTDRAVRPSATLRWSRAEVLRELDFASYTAEELAEARWLMARMRPVGATRRSRRLTRSARVGRHPDLRATARRALRTGGEAVHPIHRRRSVRPRRIVLLLDVSGSMEPYARVYVRFLQAAVSGRAGVEAFAFGTRLTRITRELAGLDPDGAVVAASRRVVDWSGGTRLGEGMRRFNDEWGVRGLARGAVVVIVSDGWDRGDPERLGSEMARLRRVAHRIVWVNPLKATEGYAPTAQGMAAALPYCDHFVEGHNLDALDRVIVALGD